MLLSAKQPENLFVVLTRKKVSLVLAKFHGNHWLMASLLYGLGLRLMECIRLRIKDIDFIIRQLLFKKVKVLKTAICQDSCFPSKNTDYSIKKLLMLSLVLTDQTSPTKNPSFWL